MLYQLWKFATFQNYSDHAVLTYEQSGTDMYADYIQHQHINMNPTPAPIRRTPFARSSLLAMAMAPPGSLNKRTNDRVVSVSLCDEKFVPQ